VLDEQTQLLIRDIANEIQEIMTDVSGVSPTETSQGSIIGILQTVVELQKIFLTQKAEYVITLVMEPSFQNGATFDGSRMEFVNQEEETTQSKVAFFVFPVLEKYGDESGENLSVRNVLLKARVFCQTEIED
jgi:hypothetical protein